MARTTTGGLRFHHPAAFWIGTAGAVLHLPMYLGAEDTGYQLTGMAVDLP